MNDEMKNEKKDLNDEEMNSKELNDEELTHAAGGRRTIIRLTCPNCGATVQAHIGDRTRTCNNCGYVINRG